jgi:hypothetical protein
MEASIVELRYKMKEVLKALDRNEKVRILYHGKVRGIIHPSLNQAFKKTKDHPFYGMSKDSKKSVLEIMNELRGPRFNAF